MGMALLNIRKKAEAKDFFRKYLNLAPNVHNAEEVRKILKGLE
jgi:hypothetical protein